MSDMTHYVVVEKNDVLYLRQITMDPDGQATTVYWTKEQLARHIKQLQELHDSIQDDDDTK